MTETFERWSPRRIEGDDQPVEAVAQAERPSLQGDVRPWVPADLGAVAAKAAAGSSSHAASTAHAQTQAQRQQNHQSELDALRQQAQQQGYEEGLRRGQQEAHNLLAQQSQQLQNTIAALRNVAGQLDESLEREVIGLSVGLAAQLLRHELQQHPEWLHEQIQAATAMLPGAGGGLEIHLHPADVDTLQQHFAQSGEVAEGNWQFVEDANISPGGFMLANDNSRVDERLETRLAAILRQAFANSPFVSGGRVDD
ncbi:FliH/SctL family protein [Spongiibacter taiwanensis]|uniref:FliH/SctL family protein n=1 Tax=Spongiibacter taiwanensis TaxID=1748242 RepID=UPI002034CC46|nr:FliH/SctL family protein [Spongiibacter taiwanensis]USA43795.1 FliH/SctL family protein [Spongiibacter taiwanensis]